MNSFFISYTNVDKAYADWITWVLREAGNEVFFQSWDLWSDDNCILHTKREVANADITILVLSEDYLQLEFTRPKCEEIFIKIFENQDRRLLLIRVRECQPKGLLRSIACIDLVGLKANAARQNILGLIQEWQSVIIKPSTISTINIISSREQSVDSTQANPDTVKNLDSLGTPYDYTEDKTDNTERLLKEALASSRQSSSKDSSDVVNCLYRLGWFYYSQDRYDDSEPFFQEALSINKKLLGNNHPNVVDSLYKIAEIYEYQGRYGEMTIIYKEVTEINRQLSSNVSLVVAQSLKTLAAHYSQENNFNSAETHFLEAVAIQNKIWGDEHLDLVDTFYSLAWLYFNQKIYDQAELFFLKSLKINKQWWGNEHVEVASSLISLALLYRTQKRYQEAESLLLESLRILDQNNFDALSSLHELSEIYEQQENFSRAEKLLIEIVGRTKKHFGNEHKSVAGALNRLANFYRRRQDYGKAEGLYKKVFYIAQKALPDQDSCHGVFLVDFGRLHAEQGKTLEAKQIFQKALSFFLFTFGEDNPYVSDCRSHLNKLCE